MREGIGMIRERGGGEKVKGLLPGQKRDGRCPTPVGPKEGEVELI